MECMNKKKIPNSNAWMCVEHGKVLNKKGECPVCSTVVLNVVEKITLTPELVEKEFSKKTNGKDMDKTKDKKRDLSKDMQTSNRKKLN